MTSVCSEVKKKFNTSPTEPLMPLMSSYALGPCPSMLGVAKVVYIDFSDPSVSQLLLFGIFTSS